MKYPLYQITIIAVSNKYFASYTATHIYLHLIFIKYQLPTLP